MSDEYQAQEDFDDVVVEYAASPEEAGCGCFGCASLLAIFVLMFSAILLTPAHAWAIKHNFW